MYLHTEEVNSMRMGPGTQHNGTYPLNYAALCEELPRDISFWHNSLVY